MPKNEFLAKIDYVDKIQETEALGVVNIGPCKIRVRQWSEMEGDINEKRDLKVWIKVKSLPPYI